MHGIQQKCLCRGLSPVPLSLKNISKFILKYFLDFILILKTRLVSTKFRFKSLDYKQTNSLDDMYMIINIRVLPKKYQHICMLYTRYIYNLITQ